ncbi:STAS domain-containing protein [Nonomuraea jiangxiensis]|uniref:Anti-sigma factor antagonist n=1 Tax=Nonomuraea jiangxiensis TaxID=633440 RepID=A0A1G8F8J2_9ACTN|nr:STAS domain-containing protein [Nonomuraea jiangxiensis]SDH78464.1 anti-sigma B factor antagonist/stage II sporulation protein AA (anti-sigma F factor antagonist) [Nonomuraea jiangxiensis]
MVVRHWREDLCTVIQVTGDLDVAGAPRLRAELEQATTVSGPLNLILDFTEVPFCDSVGLGVLVGLHNQVKRRKGRMIVVLAPGMIRHLLTITNLDRHFETSESLAEARAAMGSAA